MDMRQQKKYSKDEIERLLRSPDGQALLKALHQPDRQEQIGWLSEDGTLESAQRVLDEIKAQARQEAAQILAQEGRQAKPRRRWNRLGRAPSRGRKAALVACICLLFCCFWVTEPGIALAHHIQQIVVTLRGNVLNIAQLMPRDALPNELNYADLPETFASLEDAAQYLQRPVAVVQHVALTLESIEAHTMEGHYIMLWNTYTFVDGKRLITRQFFYDSEVLTTGSASLATEQIGTFNLPNDAIMYYGIDHRGEAGGLAVWPYGQFSLSGEVTDTAVFYSLMEAVRFIEP